MPLIGLAQSQCLRDFIYQMPRIFFNVAIQLSLVAHPSQVKKNSLKNVGVIRVENLKTSYLSCLIGFTVPIPSSCEVQ